MTIVHILIYIAVLGGGTLIARAFPRYFMLAVILLPVIGTPFWMQEQRHELFTWIKLYSVIFGVFWSMLLRISRLKERSWALWLGLSILWLNIIEAVVYDVVSNNYINALSGVLVIACSFNPSIKSVMVFTGEKHDLQWKISRWWIAAYSFWNLTFVYMHFDHNFTAAGLITLGTALALSIEKPEQWLFARAVTLLMHLVIAFNFTGLADSLIWDGWFHAELVLPMQVTGLFITAICVYEKIRGINVKPDRAGIA